MSITMKPSLYLETTILSYLAARTSDRMIIAGKQALTHEFWERERSDFDLFVSDYVYEECEKGDPDVAKRRLTLLNGISILKKTPDVEPLADLYMKLLSIPSKSKIDAQHLAICCVYGIDILLSWNCAHLGIESMQVILKYNNSHGLLTPQMITPDYIVEKYKEGSLDE